jgi:hypothetical protein
MLHLVKLDRSYGPETIAAMTTAFDMVCQSLSARMNANEDVKRTLALAILRLADRGEREPILIADAAFSELAGSDRSANGDVPQRVSAWAARRPRDSLPV